ncbi:MAG: hypothetical protein QGF59_08305, partial [Pirellulaceae bacterium]|nr:hypothetical protein [Pirellulaceae bacterium]
HPSKIIRPKPLGKQLFDHAAVADNRDRPSALSRLGIRVVELDCRGSLRERNALIAINDYLARRPFFSNPKIKN